MKEIFDYLTDVCAVAEGKKANITVHKPNSYLLCPCSGDKLNNAPILYNTFVNSNLTNAIFRPFDIVNSSTKKTYFDAVRNSQNQLTPACKLYRGNDKKSAYVDCYNNNGANMFCLSPAWGIVRADYCLPDYEVSFGNGFESELNRKGEYINPLWRIGMVNTFNHLSTTKSNIPLVVIGGANYIRRAIYLYKIGAIKNPLFIITNSHKIENECKKDPNLKNNCINVKSSSKMKWYYAIMRII